MSDLVAGGAPGPGRLHAAGYASGQSSAVVAEGLLKTRPRRMYRSNRHLQPLAVWSLADSLLRLCLSSAAHCVLLALTMQVVNRTPARPHSTLAGIPVWLLINRSNILKIVRKEVINVIERFIRRVECCARQVVIGIR